METECRVHTLVADVAMFAEDQVLLVRYADMAKYDKQSGWFLPDDELNYLEHPERAGARILEEQLGLSRSKPRLHHIESFKGDSGAWHMSFHNRLTLDRKPRLKPAKALAQPSPRLGGPSSARSWRLPSTPSSRSSRSSRESPWAPGCISFSR